MSSLFVSYAHVDNQPVSGEPRGWISHFIDNLRGEVNRRLGRAEHFDLWMDFRLKGNDELTPALEKQISEAQTLLLFFSEGWRASEWCRQELELFTRDPAKCHDGRIFLVELDGLKTENKPTIVQDVLGFRFWEKTGDERIRRLGYPLPQAQWREHASYFDALYNLADALADQLKQSPPAPHPAAAKATVYLAPVNDALHGARERLATELRQFDIASLPAGNELDILDFKDQLLKDLAVCSHFIQLLDADSNMGVPASLSKIAQEAGKPMLQWHERGLDQTQASDEQRKFLQGPQVIVSTLSEFAAHVRLAVLPKPLETPAPPNGKKLVFVHAGPEDLELAGKIVAHLNAQGHGHALPSYKGQPGEIRARIERNLKLCDAFLFVQHETPDEAVGDHLADAFSYLSDLGKSLPMAVCRKPDAEVLQFCPPALHICPCPADFDRRCVEQFLQATGL